MPRIKANLVSVYVIRNVLQGTINHIELLMLQRPADHIYAGDWQAVHGNIQLGETAWEAAIREQYEETSLPVKSWLRLAEVESFYNPENDSLYFVPTFVSVVDPDIEPVLSDEHQAAVWRPLHQAIPMFSWETQRSTVELLRKSTTEWPKLGPALMALDLDSLRQR